MDDIQQSVVDDLVKEIDAEEAKNAEEVIQPEADETVEPVEEESSEEVEVEDKPQDESPFQGFRERVLTQYGVRLEDKYKSDAEAVNGLMHSFHKIGERDDDAGYGKELRDNPQAVYDRLKETYGRAEPEKKSESTVDWDPSMEEGLTRDDNGNMVSKPGYPSDYPKRYDAYNKQAKDTLHELIQDKDAFFAKYASQAAESAAQKAVGESMAATQEQQRAEQYVTRNKDWLFVNPTNPNEGLSPLGNTFSEAIDRAAKHGMSSEAQIEFATLAVQAKHPTSPEETPSKARKRKTATRKSAVGKKAPQASKDEILPGVSLEDQLIKDLEAIYEETGETIM